MSRPPTDAEALIAALAEEARRSAGQHPQPEPEELLDYLEGRLSAADEERLGRQLAADPEAARALLDLADLTAAGTAAGTQPPELAVRAAWRDIRDKLPEAARRPRRLPPVLSAIAASLLLTTLGLGSWVWRLQDELRRPVVVRNLVLYASRTEAEPAVELAPGEMAHLVIAPGAGEPCPSYTAEVVGPRERDRRAVELQPDPLGNLVLGLREPGAYTLRLHGCGKTEEYPFRITAHDG
jgi:hypothetical protein